VELISGLNFGGRCQHAWRIFVSKAERAGKVEAWEDDDQAQSNFK
jgi:hypothetical protein